MNHYNYAATALLNEPLPPNCFLHNVSSAVSALHGEVAAEAYNKCAQNMFVGITNSTNLGGITTFQLTVAKAGLHSIIFSSRGLSSFTITDLLVVTAGAAHHLAVLTQPDGTEIGKGSQVAPVIAVKDEANNTVNLKANIIATLVSNGSRAHGWIPQSEMVAIMRNDDEMQSIHTVEKVIDKDMTTFFQQPLGSNMSFDLGHRYNLNKIKIQCAVVLKDYNVTTTITDKTTGIATRRIVQVSASRPIDSTHLTSVDLYIKDTAWDPEAPQWKLAQRFNTAPCTFDTSTNKTSFRILKLARPVEFARYVSLVMTSSASGTAPRVAEVNFFGGDRFAYILAQR